MQKIKTVFKINRETGLASNEVVPASTWYTDLDSKATLKVDGRSFAVINSKPYVRYDRKIRDDLRHLVGTKDITEDMLKPIPAGGIPCEATHDIKTGHHPFWVPPTESWILSEYGQYFKGQIPEDGTYELIGPKIRCNVYKLDTHAFVKHGSVYVDLVDRSFEGIKSYLQSHPDIEGIVFQKMIDGEMHYAKVRQKDFGFEWNSVAEGVRAPKRQKR